MLAHEFDVQIQIETYDRTGSLCKYITVLYCIIVEFAELEFESNALCCYDLYDRTYSSLFTLNLQTLLPKTIRYISIYNGELCLASNRED